MFKDGRDAEEYNNNTKYNVLKFQLKDIRNKKVTRKYVHCCGKMLDLLTKICIILFFQGYNKKEKNCTSEYFMPEVTS